MKHTVSNGIYTWSFKIINIVEPDNWDDFIIGIPEVNPDKDLKTICQDCYAEQHGAGISAGRGELFVSSDYESRAREKCVHGRGYGKKCITNDIIEMEINLIELCVKYIINGKDYGKAFKIKDQEYKAAVYLYRDGDKLEIV